MDIKNIQKQIIDWERVAKAIYQKINKTCSLDYIRLEILPLLEELHKCTGEYTSNRSMLTSIGCNLVSDNPKVIIPVCPDYSHENGLYTMKSVFDGISLIAQKHIIFIKYVCSIIPKLQVEFLVADNEVKDELLCKKMGLTKEVFLERIIRSKDALQDSVSQFGWSVNLMTDVVQNIVVKEKQIIDFIQSEVSYKKQIEYDTLKRSSLYSKIDATLSWEEKCLRTIHTAAQYYCLGYFCKSRGYLVCNHTTTNLAWYLKSGVAIIHNPVSIY